MDRHDHLKRRTAEAQQRPFVNDKLRKAFNVKGHLRRKYQKINSSHSWNTFRERRNLVTKMKRDSLKNYFDEECNQQPQTNRTFWNVVKPLVSNKGHSETYAISLFENRDDNRLH